MKEMKEDEIKDWVKNLNSLETTSKKKYDWITNILDNYLFDITYWWRNSIIYPIKSFFKGINNFLKWRKIIFKDRWWDYYFLLKILHFKLQDMEYHWGKDTHYVKDYEEKKILKNLLEDLEWMLDDENEFNDGYEEEYKKRSRRFFNRLDRHHRKLWD